MLGDKGELAINYLARLWGASASLNFTVTCTKCNENTSYAEKILSTSWSGGC